MKKWFKMQKKGDTLEIMIHDQIGGWGITARSFIDEVKAKNPKHIDLHLNTPGGSVFEGNAIYNFLEAQDATITVFIDGWAASMGSIIAMTGDHIVMPENTFLMIHNPQIMTAGDSKALRKDADLLDKIKKSAVKAYQRHAVDKTEEEIAAAMDEETWLSAEEAVEWGLADEMIDPVDVEEPENHFGKLQIPENVFAAVMKYDGEVQNEHCFILNDPEEYSEFARMTKRDESSKKTFSIIAGKRKETGEWENQECRYKKGTWSESEARAHARKNGFVKQEFANEDDSNKFFKSAGKPKTKGVSGMEFYDKNGNLVNEKGEILKTKAQLDAEKMADPAKAAHQKEIEEAAKKAREEAATAERTRISEINSIGESLKLKKEFTQKLIDENKTVDEARAAMLDAHLEGNQSVADAKVTGDEKSKKIEGLTNAIMVRAGIETDKEKIQEAHGSEFAHCGLQALVRHCAGMTIGNRAYTANSQDVGSMFLEMLYGSGRFSPNMAMGINTNDLLSVVSTVANKSLLKGYENANTTFQLVTRMKSFSDLKTGELYKTSEGPDVLEIPEGQAPKLGKISDKKETAKLKKWGRAHSITEEAIINDDLSVFTDMPAKWGRAIARKMNYEFWNLLYSNPTLTEDSTAVFAAAHANLVAVGAGGQITADTLTAAYLAFRNFKGLQPDGGESADQYLNIVPMFLAVGPSREYIANQYTSSAYLPGGTNPEPNQFGPQGRMTIQPLVEPLIDAFDTNYPWYVMANPMDVDYALMITLAGRETPKTASRVGGAAEVKGIIYDVEHFFIPKIPDYRGLYKNAGA